MRLELQTPKLGLFNSNNSYICPHTTMCRHITIMRHYRISGRYEHHQSIGYHLDHSIPVTVPQHPVILVYVRHH